MDLVLARSFRLYYEASHSKQQLPSKRELLSASLKRSQQYYSSQAWFVDFPIILASALTWALSLWATSKIDDASFLKGVYSGGWLVHLAMSQVVFIIVSYRVLSSRIADIEKAISATGREQVLHDDTIVDPKGLTAAKIATVAHTLDKD